MLTTTSRSILGGIGKGILAGNLISISASNAGGSLIGTSAYPYASTLNSLIGSLRILSQNTICTIYSAEKRFSEVFLEVFRRVLRKAFRKEFPKAGCLKKNLGKSGRFGASASTFGPGAPDPDLGHSQIKVLR